MIGKFSSRFLPAYPLKVGLYLQCLGGMVARGMTGIDLSGT